VTVQTTETSPLVRARIAGVLYLMLPFAPFGLLYVPSRLIVSGDPAATASNIMASETLFRLGIVSNLLSPLVNLFLVLALYQLLKPVNKNMASLMVIFILVSVPISMLNELPQFAVLLLLNGANYLNVFSTEQLHTLMTLFLNLHKQGIHIAQIFWGLWLFPMGYLIFKSGFLPRIIGIALIIGCFGYLIDSFAAFLLPTLKLNLILLTSWGELLLPLWLLFKGVNVEQWKKLAAESA
jgi:hypothetical protein